MSAKALVHIVNNDSAYITAVGTQADGTSAKFYPNVAPQGARLPYGVYTVVSAPTDNNKDERGPTNWHYQIDHYAASKSKAMECQEAFIDAITPYHTWKGAAVAGEELKSIRVMDEASSGFNNDTDSDATMIEISMRINP